MDAAPVSSSGGSVDSCVTLVADRALPSRAGLEPAAVEGLVAARSDIPPPEAKQAVAECRELYTQKRGGPLLKGGSTLRLADFDALVAALAPL